MISTDRAAVRIKAIDSILWDRCSGIKTEIGDIIFVLRGERKVVWRNMTKTEATTIITQWESCLVEDTGLKVLKP